MDSLLFDRFQQLVIMLSKVKQEEAKDRLINSAFIAFQMGAGGDKTFGQYLEKIGLSETHSDLSGTQVTAKEALAKAQKIRDKIRSKK